MGLSGDQTVTVDSAARTYSNAWVKKYAKEIAKGNTATKKAAITDGTSIERITHDEVNGIEKHIVSFEDYVSTGTDVIVKKLRKIQITLTCESDDPTEQTATADLASGVCDYLKTVLTDLFADSQ